jgi:hypothetical protein
MKNQATYRADGKIEITTVNAAGTRSTTVFSLGSDVGSGLVSNSLVRHLNEAFEAAEGDDESDMGDPHAEFDAATELCATKEHYIHEGCECHVEHSLVGAAW